MDAAATSSRPYPCQSLSEGGEGGELEQCLPKIPGSDMACACQMCCSICQKDLWVSCQPEGHVLVVLQGGNVNVITLEKLLAHAETSSANPSVLKNFASDSGLSDKDLQYLMNSSANSVGNRCENDPVLQDHLGQVDLGLSDQDDEVMQDDPWFSDSFDADDFDSEHSDDSFFLDSDCSLWEESDDDYLQHEVVTVRNVKLEGVPNVQVLKPILSSLHNPSSSGAISTSIHGTKIPSQRSKSALGKDSNMAAELPYNASKMSSKSQSQLGLGVNRKQDRRNISLPGVYHRCELCNSQIKHRKDMIRHLRVHAEGKPFVCRICDKAFRQQYDLNKHELLVHEGLRPFVCDICDKAFSAKARLEEHKSTHHCDKPYICQHCGKSFRYRVNLTRHIDIFHTGETPKKNFSCQYCDKKFSQKSNMLEHERVHSSDTQYFCELCGKGYRHMKHLKTHYDKHASGEILPGMEYMYFEDK